MTREHGRDGFVFILKFLLLWIIFSLDNGVVYLSEYLSHFLISRSLSLLNRGTQTACLVCDPRLNRNMQREINFEIDAPTYGQFIGLSNDNFLLIILRQYHN